MPRKVPQKVRRGETDNEFALRMMHAHMGGGKRPWEAQDVEKLRMLVATSHPPQEPWDALARATVLAALAKRLKPGFDLVAAYKADIERSAEAFIEEERVMGPGARQGYRLGETLRHGDGSPCTDECSIHGEDRRAIIEREDREAGVKKG